MLRHLILGLLRQAGPCHGYALMKAYRDGSGRALSIGNIYRELQRLRSDGFVRAGTKPSGADPRRIPYEVTDAGAAAFEAWLRSPPADGADGQENDHALRAFFVLSADWRAAERVLRDWREDLETRSKTTARAREQVLSAAGSERRGLPLWLGRRLKHLAVDLEFVDELQSAVERSRVRRNSMKRGAVETRTSEPRRRAHADER